MKTFLYRYTCILPQDMHPAFPVKCATRYVPNICELRYPIGYVVIQLPLILHTHLYFKHWSFQKVSSIIFTLQHRSKHWNPEHSQCMKPLSPDNYTDFLPSFLHTVSDQKLAGGKSLKITLSKIRLVQSCYCVYIPAMGLIQFPERSLLVLFCKCIAIKREIPVVQLDFL